MMQCHALKPKENCFTLNQKRFECLLDIDRKKNREIDNNKEGME